MTIFKYTILFSSIFCGGLFAFWFRGKLQNYLQLILSFSGAYIIGITALHLIPETFFESNENLY